MLTLKEQTDGKHPERHVLLPSRIGWRAVRMIFSATAQASRKSAILRMNSSPSTHEMIRQRRIGNEFGPSLHLLGHQHQVPKPWHPATADEGPKRQVERRELVLGLLYPYKIGFNSEADQ